MLASMDDPRLNTVESILQEGTKTQRRLITQKAWHPTSKAGSVFSTKHEDNSKKPSIEKPKPTTPKKEKEKEKEKKKDRPTHDRLGNPIDRHPPKSGESNQRENALTKKTESWCGNPKCQRWGNHVTTGHDEWYKKMCESRKKRNEKKEKKPEVAKIPEGGALTIPRANFVSTIGAGFDGVYPF